MQPLESMPREDVRATRALLLDIDDTLTTDGRLTAPAYAALERAYAAGLIVVPITGRPAGWCDHIARMWPVHAVVGENGAFYFRYARERRTSIKSRERRTSIESGSHRALIKRYRDDAAFRASNRTRLQAVGARILAAVPGTALASDQHYREADLAIDFCEDVPRLDDAAIDRIVAIMTEHGMTAKVSSIHVNGWFGAYDKLGMTRTLFAEQFDLDIDESRERFVFVGDSPNDGPMFEFFPHAVGVANVRDALARVQPPPRYVTRERAGGGFVELVQFLIAARS